MTSWIRSKVVRRPGLAALAGLFLFIPAAALSTVAIATLTATPAAASSTHTGLVGSSPANGTRLTQTPGDVRFTFDQTLQPVQGWDAVIVTGPDGMRWPAHSVRVTGNTITAKCGHLGPPGDYHVSYRVISGDGHPVAGHITVTLGQVGPGTPATSTLAMTGGGVPAWAWLVELALGIVVTCQAVVRSRAAGATKPAAVAGQRQFDSPMSG
ncbi:copper resistance protein CopC [Kribbella sp. NBC_01245]|uniref:copper resistance CopC family protein n=1 Tax=Kribbella sp. NBC_01245 TaxID=2903578 RepID=UPI002E2D8506|nr:copper resistance CopC family protein [Kribbella sp. NBC_01245]